MDIRKTATLILSLLLTVQFVAAEAEEKASRPSYTFYGYIKLDSSYDSSRLDVGNFARWVVPQPGGEDDDEFNMTVNQSRFGVNLNGPSNDRWAISGKAEIDFYGGGAENKAEPFMRHAYMQIHMKDAGLYLLAGQTWDLFSPLNAPTVNYSVAWWSGNIGYRRPQVRLTKVFGESSGTTLTIAGALARTIGHRTGFDPGDSGEDNAFPTIQGRIGVSVPMPDGGAFTLGISGHFGTEEYDVAADGSFIEFDSWSANLDLSLTLAGGIVFKGEYYTGQNLDSYLGGIGQGLNLSTLSEIESTGGWASVTIPAGEGMRFSIAGALEQNDEDTLVSGQRSSNSSFWANMFYEFMPNVTIALEAARWETEYKDGESWDSMRGQLAFIYAF